MLRQLMAVILATATLLGGVVTGSAYAADAEEKKSIYCDDGSLCVPEGEPEPECD